MNAIAPHSQRAKLTSLVRIREAVAAEFGVSVRELLSPRRARSVAWPRQVAMWLAVQITGLSLPQIGEDFERDHTTVMYARQATERRLAIDAELRGRVERLRRSLTDGATEAAETPLAAEASQAVDAALDEFRALLRQALARDPYGAVEALAAALRTFTRAA